MPIPQRNHKRILKYLFVLILISIIVSFGFYTTFGYSSKPLILKMDFWYNVCNAKECATQSELIDINHNESFLNISKNKSYIWVLFNSSEDLGDKFIIVYMGGYYLPNSNLFINSKNNIESAKISVWDDKNKDYNISIESISENYCVIRLPKDLSEYKGISHSYYLNIKLKDIEYEPRNLNIIFTRYNGRRISLIYDADLFELTFPDDGNEVRSGQIRFESNSIESKTSSIFLNYKYNLYFIFSTLIFSISFALGLIQLIREFKKDLENSENKKDIIYINNNYLENYKKRYRKSN